MKFNFRHVKLIFLLMKLNFSYYMKLIFRHINLNFNYIKFNFGLMKLNFMIFKLNLALSQVRICRLPPSQKWPYLHKRCAMFWNEWKIMYQIFSFWAIGCQRAAHSTTIFFCSKLAKFTGRIGIDLTMIFIIHDFFLCDS